MIEVLRQTLGELANSLALLGFIMPETVMTQLDNCYENKNQFVFAFFSIMVETKQIKTVELHFLLVGHTHCSVDQYFSVLSKVGRLMKTINFDGVTHFGIPTETGPSPFHCDAIIYGSFLSAGARDTSSTSKSITTSRCCLRFCGCNETVYLPRDKILLRSSLLSTYVISRQMHCGVQNQIDNQPFDATSPPGRSCSPELCEYLSPG